MNSRMFSIVLKMMLLLFGATILVAAEQASPITQGTILAQIIGPNSPTPETILPTKPNQITNYWVTLNVVDTRDGFARELKGKTIRLPTCAFDKSLLGQTLPLLMSYSPGGYSDYCLMCTSVGAAHLAATMGNQKK